MEFVELTDGDLESKLQAVPYALVDFYASWCGACRIAAPMFKRVAAEVDLPLFKIDAENNPRARGLVEIKNLPTLVLFKNGHPAGSISATQEAAVREFLKNQNFPVKSV